MYLQYYGLRELPFELTPNPRFLFLSGRHREALSNLKYGLYSAKALTVLVGEAGTGKTTVLAAALESELCRGVRPVVLRNPTLTRDEFIETLALKFGLGPEVGRSKAMLIEELERALSHAHSQGYVYALIVDEAHTLSDELLEEVRLLANIETTDHKLLPIVLVGQPELAGRLNQQNLRQLKQRVSLRCEITALSVVETAEFIATRIHAAGGTAASLFSREAVVRIHEVSRGIPRTINVICDNALVNGMALERRLIDLALIEDVTRDFDLEIAPDATLAASVVAAPAATALVGALAATPAAATSTIPAGKVAKPSAVAVAVVDETTGAPLAAERRRRRRRKVD